MLHEDLGAPNTVSQFNKDLNALYGALESACEDGVGQEILIKYHDSADGLCAWIDMLQLYDAGGDIDLCVEQLESVIDTKYHSRYPGGLGQWISDYEAAFAELPLRGVFSFKEDSDWKRRVIKNLDTKMFPYLMMSAHKMSYQEMIKVLRSIGLKQKQESSRYATMKSHNTYQPNQEESFMEQFLANQISTIPYEIWKQLPKDIIEIINKARDEEKRNEENNKI